MLMLRLMEKLSGKAYGEFLAVFSIFWKCSFLVVIIAIRSCLSNWVNLSQKNKN